MHGLVWKASGSFYFGQLQSYKQSEMTMFRVPATLDVNFGVLHIIFTIEEQACLLLHWLSDIPKV